MKKFNYFLGLLLFSIISHAQTLPTGENISLDQQLSNIPQSTVTSGIIYERVISTSNLYNFNKVNTFNTANFPYFKQALFWYVLRQMEMGGFNHPQFNFAYCDQQWKHYCIAAGNDAMMPSPAMMKRFGSSWVSFFTDNMSEEDEFSDLDMDTAPDTQ